MTRPGSRWWRWPAALVVLAYVLAQVVEVTMLRVDGHAYLSLRDWWASPLGRVTTAAVVVCVLVHGLFGLAHAWGALVGEPERVDDPGTRAVVWFVVVALAVAAATAAMWPWLRTVM